MVRGRSSPSSRFSNAAHAGRDRHTQTAAYPRDCHALEDESVHAPSFRSSIAFSDDSRTRRESLPPTLVLSRNKQKAGATADAPPDRLALPRPHLQIAPIPPPRLTLDNRIAKGVESRPSLGVAVRLLPPMLFASRLRFIERGVAADKFGAAAGVH